MKIKKDKNKKKPSKFNLKRNKKKSTKKMESFNSSFCLSKGTKPFVLTHTWQGLCSHVMRKNRRARRCEIGGMDISLGEVSIMCFFNEKTVSKTETKTSERKKKSFSPCLLAATSLWWARENIVSSDEEDSYQDIITGPAEHSILPPLECTNIHILQPEQQRKLKWQLTQVNNLLALHFPRPLLISES